MGFSEPSEEIRLYAEAHGLKELDLRSSTVQHILVLRIQHPEWEKEKVMKEQQTQHWLDKSVLCIDQFIQVGRVEKIEGGMLTLALADQFQEAADWIHHRYFTDRYRVRGLFILPELPFQLTYEKAEQRRLAVYWRSVELASLPPANLFISLDDAR